jgi:hypothetical protein
MNRWIFSWSLLYDDSKYFVCPVNAYPDGTIYLGQPHIHAGWQIRQGYKEGCYAALRVPAFDETADSIRAKLEADKP